MNAATFIKSSAWFSRYKILFFCALAEVRQSGIILSKPSLDVLFSTRISLHKLLFYKSVYGCLWRVVRWQVVERRYSSLHQLQYLSCTFMVLLIKHFIWNYFTSMYRYACNLQPDWNHIFILIKNLSVIVTFENLWILPSYKFKYLNPFNILQFWQNA